MAKKPFRASVVLAAACAALPMAATTPAHAQPSLLPASCLQVHQRIPLAPDGTYLLAADHKLFTVHCAKMATAPSEYITLAHTEASANFSQYTAGGASPGTSVRTAFTRLRLDPATFTVDIGDLAYASSTGSLNHAGSGNTVTSMPYAVAMSCTGSPDGIGNIDLRGTAVRIDNAFAPGGAGPSGSATVSPDGQTAALKGGGFCGWLMPTPVRYNPFNPQPGMENLKLDCAKQAATGSNLCIGLGGTANAPQVREQGGQRVIRLHSGGRPVAVLDAYGRVKHVS